MAVVAGVLLDHVHERPPHRDPGADLLARAHVVERIEAGQHLAGVRALAAPVVERLRDVGVVDVVEVGFALVAADAAPRPPSQKRNQLCSTSAMWRTSPSNDSVEGGTERIRSWSSVSPSHFMREGRAVVLEPAVEHRALVGLERRLGAFDRRSCPTFWPYREHVIHDAELFTVGPDEVVVTFRTDGDDAVTTRAGDHEVTTTGPYHSARITGLEPDTEYPLRVDGAERHRAAARPGDDARAARRPRLATFATVNDVHFGEVECGRLGTPRSSARSSRRSPAPSRTRA